MTVQSLSSLITSLAGQPTMDKLAQSLVLDFFADFDPRGALISGFDSHGRVRTLGSFGLDPDVVRGLQHLSVWDHAPAVDAIRIGEPLIFLDGDEVRAKYPGLRDHEALLRPTVVWPLGLGIERLGAVQMQFIRAPYVHALVDRFTQYMPIVALYVGLAQPSSTSNGSRMNHRLPESGEPLTERQRVILHMLAKGMTNPQIAARIGFSDSTVRQETMHIYRHLGVSGRREAARAAELRGLLSQEPVPA